MEKIKLNTKNKKIAKTGSWLSRYLHKVKVYSRFNFKKVLIKIDLPNAMVYST